MKKVLYFLLFFQLYIYGENEVENLEVKIKSYRDVMNVIYSETYPAKFHPDDHAWSAVTLRKPMDIATLVVLGYGMMKDKDHVYYESQASNILFDGWFLFKDAHTASFEYVGGAFYKDKNNVYFKDGNNIRVVSVQDRATLVYLGGNFYKDKTKVYEYTRRENLESVKGAHPGSFEIINDIFAKDKNAIFIEGRSVKNSDPSTFQKIDENYYKDNNLVYFLESNSARVFWADAKSFVVVDESFVKDSNGVYDKNSGKTIPNIAHPDSFEKIAISNATQRFYKDEAYIYMYDDYDHLTKLAADTKTLEIISYESFERERYGNYYLYIKDSENVYSLSDLGGKKILDADLATFESLGAFSKDKNRIYYLGEHTVNIDYATFRRAGDYYIDKNYLYIGSTMFQIKEFDMSLFRALRYPYHIYDKSVYYYDGGKMQGLEGADAATFSVLEYKYAKDKTRVYYDISKVLAGAHAASFEVLDEKWSKDKTKVYKREDGVISKTKRTFDAASFELIKNSTYIRDKNGVYSIYAGADIKNTKDAATFEILNDTYARDKNHIYSGEHIIKDADLASFEAIDEVWAKDKNSLYRYGWTMLHIDVKTFQKIDDEYVSDKNAIYNKDGKIVKVFRGGRK